MLKWFTSEHGVYVIFDVTTQKVMGIGAKMEEICPEAYMNGYNWDAFLTYYLQKQAPDLLVGMDPDPEADMYAAHYAQSAENEARAAKFVELVNALLENEDEIYKLIREEGGQIEWD